MAKAKKARPDKYDTKLAINRPFVDVIKASVIPMRKQVLPKKDDKKKK